MARGPFLPQNIVIFIFFFLLSPLIASSARGQTSKEADRTSPEFQFILPRANEDYPNFSTYRVAWTNQSDRGAKSYRFRFWSPAKIKSNPRPRWEIVTKEPWMVFDDVPDTSYIFLDSGLYPIEVEALNERGEPVSPPIKTMLNVSQQAYLPKRETEIELRYSLAPNLIYRGVSGSPTSGSLGGEPHRFSSISNQLEFDGKWWLSRHFGLNTKLGYQGLTVEGPQSLGPAAPSSTVYFPHFSLDTLWRTYLSNYAKGWEGRLIAGLGLQEFPLVEYIGSSTEALQISRPRSADFRFGLGVKKRWDIWSLEWSAVGIAPVFVLNSPTKNAEIRSFLGGSTELKFVRKIKKNFGLSLGVGGNYRRLRFEPKPFHAISESFFYHYSLFVGANWNW